MPTQYWTCDFGCGYHSESKRDVEKHEENCDLNTTDYGNNSDV